MKNTWSATLLVLALAAPAHADFAAGAKAYAAGDFAEAIKQWTPDVEKGNVKSMASLGVLYEHGKGVPQDYKKAAELYTKAAELKSANAQFGLGSLYEGGKGVKQDIKKAIELYTAAAEQDNTDAQAALGNLLLQPGPDQNTEQAAKWLSKSADKGDAAAQFNLAVLHYEGNGVTQDLKKAAELFRKAAEQGDSGSMFNLANMYYKGQGLTKDNVMSYVFYGIAGKSGNEAGSKRLAVVSKILNPKQLTEAKGIVDAWKVGSPLPGAAPAAAPAAVPAAK